MRICFIASAFSWHVKKWAEYFTDRGHEIHVISPTYQVSILGAKVYNITRFSLIPYLTTPVYTYLSKMVIRKIKPDILHAMQVIDYGYPAARVNFKPFVVTAFGSDVLLAPQKSKRAKKKAEYALSKADLITCDSERAREEIIKLGGDSRKVHSVYFGVDQRMFHLNVDTLSLRKSLSIGDARVVLIPKYLAAYNNIDIIIRAIPLVLKQFPETVFIFKYPSDSQNLRPKLEKKAKSLEITKNVRFVGYLADYGALPAFFRMAEVSVLIPSSDSSPRAMFESMACGVPLIVSDIEANREWIEDGKNGLIVPLRDEVRTAEAIVKLLSNKNLRENFVNHNFNIVAQKADYQKNMAAMEKLYRALLK